MASDPKGVYFAPNNTGFATILPRESRGTAFDDAARYGAMERRYRAQQEQFKLKRQQDDIDKIKNFKSWKFYTPAVNKKMEGLINMVKKGDYNPLDLQMGVNEYASLAQSSLQLQEDFEAARSMYKADKKVVAADQWYLDKYHNDPSEENLTKRQTEGQDPYAFLQEEGGSKYVNTSEAFQDVVNGAFKDFVIEKSLSDPTRSYIGTGLQQITQEEVESRFRNFAKVNPVTGEIQVKDVDQLIDDGVLSVFMDDPYAKRVLQDRALEIAGDRPVSEEDLGIALKEQLEPRTAGTSNRMTRIKLGSEKVDFVARRGNQEKITQSDWLKKARAGDQEAWDIIIGRPYQGYVIENVTVSPERGDIRLTLINEKADPLNPASERAITRTVPYSSMSNSELLRWYSEGLKRSKGARYTDEQPGGELDEVNISNDNAETGALN